jgi:hypothetical protein
MQTTPVLITINPWSLGCLHHPTFWFPITQVCDFLDGDAYPAEAENCRSRPARPVSPRGDIRVMAEMAF